MPLKELAFSVPVKKKFFVCYLGCDLSRELFFSLFHLLTNFTKILPNAELKLSLDYPFSRQLQHGTKHYSKKQKQLKQTGHKDENQMYFCDLYTKLRASGVFEGTLVTSN